MGVERAGFYVQEERRPDVSIDREHLEAMSDKGAVTILRLMGHSDINLIRRYANQKASPVELLK